MAGTTRAAPAHSIPAPPSAELAEAVRAGLGGPGPKTLPSRFFYDALGSALFDAICLLPEYGLTRADERILSGAAREIADLVEIPALVAELGAGSGTKTRHVLEALATRQASDYYPIDVSPAALDRCRVEMARVPRVRVEPIEADYLDGLARVTARRRPNERILLLFLGSTIGNFDRPVADEFLRAVRGRLEQGDALLLGTDLVKPVPDLIAAYDDALGVTAAFNRNLLVRINRELDANFDPMRFAHRATWNGAERRIESRLVAADAHRVNIAALGLEVAFAKGESIWTESSHKFERAEPAAMGGAAGFECVAQWTDREWPFTETLFVAR